MFAVLTPTYAFAMARERRFWLAVASVAVASALWRLLRSLAEPKPPLAAAAAAVIPPAAIAATAARAESDEDYVVAALRDVQSRIGASPRARQVTLIAVSKTKPTSLVAACHAAGQLDFGENYVQEVGWRGGLRAALALPR